MIEAINSTTYKADDLGDVKPEIVIGGTDVSKFEPEINMSFHDDEFLIKLKRKDKIVTTETASLSADKISQKIGDETDEYYIKDGRLKWDIVFDKCPASMDIDFELTASEGVGFYFQGELTAEEISDGCERSDEIVNSYAVYCNKKHNKYKTGKLGHITRPFVIDSNDKKEWCALKVEGEVLKITLPDKFMADATYPVRLDPTFGYTSNGGTQAAHYTSSKPIGSVYGAYTAGAGEVITKFSIYTHLQDAGNTDINAAAYTVSGTVLDARLSTETAVPVTSTDIGWFDSAAVSIAMTEGNTYGMAVTVYGESNDVYLYWDNLYQNDYTRHNTAEALPATWTSDTNTNRTYSFYATYGSGGGGKVTHNTRPNHLGEQIGMGFGMNIH